MTSENIGFQDISGRRDNLRGKMNGSPTGRQLAIDGNFVFAVEAADPSLNPVGVPPDGTAVLWRDGTSLWLSTFTRATGWVAVQMTP